MKYYLLVLTLATILTGCSHNAQIKPQEKPEPAVVITSLSIKKDVDYIQTSDIKLSFVINNSSYEILASINKKGTTEKKNNHCSKKEYVIDLHHNSKELTPLKTFSSIYIVSPCSNNLEKNLKEINKKNTLYHLAKAYGLKISPHEITNLDMDSKSLPVLYILNSNDKYLSTENFDNASESALNTLLYQVYINNQNLSLPLVDNLGSKKFNPLKSHKMIHTKFSEKENVFYPSGIQSLSIYEPSQTLEGINECESKLCRSYIVNLSKVRSFFSKEHFNKGSEIFLAKSALIESQINASNLESKDKKKLKTSLSTLKKAYEKIKTYNFVENKKERIFFNKELTRACGVHNKFDAHIYLPVGTPIDILQKNEKAIAIKTVDIRDGYLTDPVTNKPCIQSGEIVWLRREPASISTQP